MNRDLTNRQELIEYLKSHGLWLKKESGQHFLTDRTVLDQILLAAALKPDDRVLEIGPGVGTLTRALAAAVPDGLVLAIEKDFKLVTVLREQCKHWKNLKIVREDGLKFVQELEPTSDWKLVANLPYNITGQFLRFLFDPNRQSPIANRCVLMLQKEVVDRLLAPPGSSKRGILTILRELFGSAERVIEVPKTAFFPVPAVDSAVINIVQQPPYTPQESTQILWLAKLGFAAKRRTLVNALSGGLHQSKEHINGWLTTAKIPVLARAEDLDLAAWHRLMMIVGTNQGRL